MFTLSKKSKKDIEKYFGRNVKEIINMDFDQIDQYIREKAQKEHLDFMFGNDDYLLGRGNIYINLNRLIQMDEIDKELEQI